MSRMILVMLCDRGRSALSDRGWRLEHHLTAKSNIAPLGHTSRVLEHRVTFNRLVVSTTEPLEQETLLA
jgi:hypothetical protein